MRTAQLEIHPADCTFSAGHFTIFSETDREPLHGHNYNVSAIFTFNLQSTGLSFDYRYYKKKLLALCHQVDRHVLLPAHSPFLKIEETEEYWHAYFNQKKLPFLKEDVVILPLTNITLEELSYWFLNNLLVEESLMREHQITSLVIKVFNGPSQSGSSYWQAK